MDFEAARRAMVDSQLRPQAVTDPSVIAAMATVERERFVPESARGFAYFDRAVPLGDQRAMTPPATLGRMLVELAVQAGERGLVVGAGTGYSAALLTQIGADVVAVECDPALAQTLAQNASLGVTLITGGLAEGAPAHGPFDFILIDGSVESIPDALVKQLKVGGRLVTALVDRGIQRLVVGSRVANGFGTRSIADVAAPVLPGFAGAHAFTF
jgi:protein-L-isoaspartate(D-aspartate) O-methyltransferase